MHFVGTFRFVYYNYYNSILSLLLLRSFFFLFLLIWWWPQQRPSEDSIFFYFSSTIHSQSVPAQLLSPSFTDRRFNLHLPTNRLLFIPTKCSTGFSPLPFSLSLHIHTHVSLHIHTIIRTLARSLYLPCRTAAFRQNGPIPGQCSLSSSLSSSSSSDAISKYSLPFCFLVFASSEEVKHEAAGHT